MYPGHWPAGGDRQFPQGGNHALVLPFDQQTLGRDAPPHVGMGQRLHQAAGIGDLEVRRPVRAAVLVDHPVDAPPSGAGPQVESAFQIFRDVVRMLDVLPVVVHHVERSVGPDGREHRLEPGVGGRQELPFLERPAGGEGRPRGGEQVAVHQVVQRVADEIGAPEPLRKPGGGVDGVPATGGEYAHLGFVDVDGSSRDGIDDGLIFVIGGKLHGGGDLEVWIPRQVTVGDDGMADVVVVPQSETVAGGVEGVAVLRVPGHRLQLQPVRPEPEVGAQRRDVDGRDFRMPGKVEGFSRQSELVGVAPRGAHLGVGPVDPVVDAVQESVDPELGIVAVESGEDHPPFVGPQVAVRVGKIKDVRSGGHQDTLLPRHQSGRKGQLLGEDAAAVELSAAGVLQDHDPALGFRLHGIVAHLQDEEASAAVEGGGHRIRDQRLGRHQLDLEPRRQSEGFQRFPRRKRRRVAAPAAPEENETGGAQERPADHSESH